MTRRQIKSTPTITERNNLSITYYLRDVSHYPMVSNEEEVELTRAIRQGGPNAAKARKRLVEANLRFVVSVANQYHQKNMELSDLISEGNIGLLKAAERFDDTRGFKFISYAVWWIRQSISASINSNGEQIRIPVNQQNLLQKYKQFCKDMMQIERRRPTIEEFAEFAELSVEKARQIVKLDTHTTSTDTPLGEDSDTTIADSLTGEFRADDIVDQQSLHYDLKSALRHLLTQREQEILTRCYGLEGPEESIEDIGHKMGLSRERVRQIREMAVAKLRESDQAHILTRYLG